MRHEVSDGHPHSEMLLSCVSTWGLSRSSHLTPLGFTLLSIVVATKIKFCKPSVIHIASRVLVYSVSFVADNASGCNEHGSPQRFRSFQNPGFGGHIPEVLKHRTINSSVIFSDQDFLNSAPKLVAYI